MCRHQILKVSNTQDVIFFNFTLLQKLSLKHLILYFKTNRKKIQTDLCILIYLTNFNKEILNQDIVCLRFSFHTNENLNIFSRKYCASTK